MVQRQLQVRNLPRLPVAHHPRVRIPAIISLPHDRRILVDRRRILHRLARPLKLRNPVRIEAHNLRQRRLRNHQAARIYAKIILARNEPRSPIHQKMLPALRHNIKHIRPPLALRVGGPVAMRDHDLPVLRRRPRRNKRAALPRSLRRHRHQLMLLRVQPRQIIIRQLQLPIHRHHVPQVHLRPIRLQPRGNALQLRPRLRLNVRPQHRPSRLAKERPVLMQRVLVLHLEHLQIVFNLLRQQASMLKPNLPRSPRQMHIRPSTLIERIRPLHPRVRRRYR